MNSTYEDISLAALSADPALMGRLPLRWYSRDRLTRNEALAALKDSIRRLGVLNPPIVRRGQNGHYYSITGNSRITASWGVLPGDKIRCLVVDCDDATAREIFLTEKLHRMELTTEGRACMEQDLGDLSGLRPWANCAAVRMAQRAPHATGTESLHDQTPAQKTAPHSLKEMKPVGTVGHDLPTEEGEEAVSIPPVKPRPRLLIPR